MKKQESHVTLAREPASILGRIGPHARRKARTRYHSPIILREAKMDRQSTPRCRQEKPLTDRERRRSLRIAVPFPVRVRGLSPCGKRLEFETELENLSAGGMLLRSSFDIRDWQNLTLVMRLSLSSDPAAPAPMVAARARFLRTEAYADRRAGYAVAFTHHRFI
jgi:hypothetical protein